MKGNDSKSPCVYRCRIQKNGSNCIGCKRTLEEINGWWDLSDEERKKILNDLELRIVKNDYKILR